MVEKAGKIRYVNNITKYIHHGAFEQPMFINICSFF